MNLQSKRSHTPVLFTSITHQRFLLHTSQHVPYAYGSTLISFIPELFPVYPSLASHTVQEKLDLFHVQEFSPNVE